MFNELDDENARNVCVIGTAIRDALFGSPEQIGREIIPVGEFININSQRFKIIGMFEHYESEQDKKLRELRMQKPAETRAVRSAAAGLAAGAEAAAARRAASSSI